MTALCPTVHCGIMPAAICTIPTSRSKTSPKRYALRSSFPFACVESSSTSRSSSDVRIRSFSSGLLIKNFMNTRNTAVIRKAHIIIYTTTSHFHPIAVEMDLNKAECPRYPSVPGIPARLNPASRAPAPRRGLPLPAAISPLISYVLFLRTSSNDTIYNTANENALANNRYTTLRTPY